MQLCACPYALVRSAMSAKKPSTVGLNYLVISGKQGMHLLTQMIMHHRLKRVRKERGNTLGLALESTYHDQEVINT